MYLDDLEHDRATEAELVGKKYTFILDKPFRWETWAAPKDKDGSIDHNKAMTGDDLRDFDNGKFFPYLHGFKQKASGPNTIEYKIGEIFGEIKNMGNAGRNGGEYYTPRPLIRTIVQVVKPQIGQRIYDGAVGSAGFLCESFNYLKAKPGLTTGDMKKLQERTFYGKEKKSLAYVIAIMNMILHGIEAPNIVHTNTLSENLADSPKSWSVDAKTIDQTTFDLSVKNPDGGEEVKHRSPHEIMDEIAALDTESAEVLGNIRGLL